MNQFLRFLSLVFSLISFQSFSQHQVEQYFNALRKNKQASLEQEIQLLLSDRSAWSQLVKYQEDSIPSVWYHAHLLIARLGQISINQKDRSWAVDQLMRSVRNKDSGVIRLAFQELCSFHRDDFSSASRDSLRSFVRQRVKHFSLLLRLVGYVGLKDQRPVIQAHLEQRKLSQSEQWSAHLALSRLGDASATEYVLSRVKVQISDALVYDLFPDLIYTRQYQAMQVLVEALKNDEPNCESADTENPKSQTCAYRIMELLAPVIKDFPLKMDVSGDLIVTDYRIALQSTREWFRNHPDYKIVDDAI